MASIETLAEILIREWVKLYRQSPKLTVAITLVLSALGGTATYLAEQHSRVVREATRLQDMNYAKQVQSLDQTRANLAALIEFVDGERKHLELSQQALQSARSEHERL